MEVNKKHILSELEYDWMESLSLTRGVEYSLLLNTWKEEEFLGESYKSNVIYQIYLVNYLLMLMKDKYKKGYNTLEELYEEFQIEFIRKSLACSLSIDLDLLLNSYGLELKGSSTNYRQLGRDYRIGDSHLDSVAKVVKLDIEYLLDPCNKYTCENKPAKEVTPMKIDLPNMRTEINNCETLFLI